MPTYDSAMDLQTQEAKGERSRTDTLEPLIVYGGRRVVRKFVSPDTAGPGGSLMRIEIIER